MTASPFPLLATLSPAEAEGLRARAQTRQLKAGEVLFYQGDPSQTAYYLLSGQGRAYRQSQAAEAITGPQALDLPAFLGGLPYRYKFVAEGPCELLAWPADSLWASAEFSAAARRYLAEGWARAQTRADQLGAELSFLDTPPAGAYGADLLPGPFRFDPTTLIFGFCGADPAWVQSLIPAPLQLLARPRMQAAPLIIVWGDFQQGLRESGPGSPFAYTETTFFIPVRYQTAPGLYIPFIFSSTYEPILLGRELYGFPKRLGQTQIEARAAHLHLGGEPQLSLHWEGAAASHEGQLVGALGACLGLTSLGTQAAFQAGEVLRRAARLPAFRRVDVYNHKKIPAPDSKAEAPRYAINELTRCSFGVMRWHQVQALAGPELQAPGPYWGDKGLRLQVAYLTQVDMRLSAGRALWDYIRRA
jgi:hypothetical protein